MNLVEEGHEHYELSLCLQEGILYSTAQTLDIEHND